MRTFEPVGDWASISKRDLEFHGRAQDRRRGAERRARRDVLPGASPGIAGSGGMEASIFCAPVTPSGMMSSDAACGASLRTICQASSSDRAGGLTRWPGQAGRGNQLKMKVEDARAVARGLLFSADPVVELAAGRAIGGAPVERQAGVARQGKEPVAAKAAEPGSRAAPVGRADNAGGQRGIGVGQEDPIRVDQDPGLRRSRWPYPLRPGSMAAAVILNSRRHVRYLSGRSDHLKKYEGADRRTFSWCARARGHGRARALVRGGRGLCGACRIVRRYLPVMPLAVVAKAVDRSGRIGQSACRTVCRHRSGDA